MKASEIMIQMVHTVVTLRDIVIVLTMMMTTVPRMMMLVINILT